MRAATCSQPRGARAQSVGDIDLSFTNFIAFNDARRELMRAKLRELVGLPTPAGHAPPRSDSAPSPTAAV
ncbi:MAG: hypothetical protein WKG32_13595 [Gemmatimonadaceae bacterium]